MEAARLKALRHYEILDTLAEAAFNRLSRIASLIFETPIALVSLIDKDRQWIKSRVESAPGKGTAISALLPLPDTK